jgi:hypothetical protein
MAHWEAPEKTDGKRLRICSDAYSFFWLIWTTSTSTSKHVQVTRTAPLAVGQFCWTPVYWWKSCEAQLVSAVTNDSANSLESLFFIAC